MRCSVARLCERTVGRRVPSRSFSEGGVADYCTLSVPEPTEALALRVTLLENSAPAGMVSVTGVTVVCGLFSPPLSVRTFR